MKLQPLHKIPFLRFVDSSLVSSTFLYMLCTAEETDANVGLASKLKTEKVL